MCCSWLVARGISGTSGGSFQKVMELVHLWTELELRLHELCNGTGAQSELGLGFGEWPRPQPSLTDSASILPHPEAEEAVENCHTAIAFRGAPQACAKACVPTANP